MILTSDSAAFAAGFAAQNWLADVNLDGAWDFNDVDTWMTDFAEDQVGVQ